MANERRHRDTGTSEQDHGCHKVGPDVSQPTSIAGAPIGIVGRNRPPTAPAAHPIRRAVLGSTHRKASPSSPLRHPRGSQSPCVPAPSPHPTSKCLTTGMVDTHSAVLVERSLCGCRRNLASNASWAAANALTKAKIPENTLLASRLCRRGRSSRLKRPAYSGDDADHA